MSQYDLTRLFVEHRASKHNRSYSCRDFTAKAARESLQWSAVLTRFTEPGSDWDNGLNEPFYDKLHDERLNIEISYSLKEAKILIEA